MHIIAKLIIRIRCTMQLPDRKMCALRGLTQIFSCLLMDFVVGIPRMVAGEILD